MRDYAEVRADVHITADVASQALSMLDIDDHGLDHLDRRYLSLLIDKFDGGPVGVETLAAALSEDAGTLEDVIEPYLLQQGLILRTARGRVASQSAWLQLGLAAPETP